MFLFEMGDDEEYGLKPMNCPGHATIFDQNNWSYRDLPKRFYENGKVYRKEQRGELSGLSRVWAFTIDDGHLFVRPDQIDDEVDSIMDMIFQVLETFELDYKVFLATRPLKNQLEVMKYGKKQNLSFEMSWNREISTMSWKRETVPSMAQRLTLRLKMH